jgi:hypothetical protein
MLGVNESFEIVTLKDLGSIGIEPCSPFLSLATYNDPVCAVTLPASAAECVLSARFDRWKRHARVYSASQKLP